MFKMNVEAYPESANTYDSLADAFLKNGDYDLAIYNHQKVFEKLPGDLNISPDVKQFLFNKAQKRISELEELINE